MQERMQTWSIHRFGYCRGINYAKYYGGGGGSWPLGEKRFRNKKKKAEVKREKVTQKRVKRLKIESFWVINSKNAQYITMGYRPGRKSSYSMCSIMCPLKLLKS